MGRSGLRSGTRTGMPPASAEGGGGRVVGGGVFRRKPRTEFVCQRPIVVLKGGKVREVPCGKKFKSSSSLCNHGRTSSVHGTFTCIACLKPFATAEKLARHRGTGVFLECEHDSCPICSKPNLVTVRLMRDHMELFHRDEWEELNRRRCAVGAVSTAGSRHLAPVPSGVKEGQKLQCPDCGSIFNEHTNDRKRNLRLHLRDRCKFTDKDGIPVTKVCECGEAFTVKRFYYHHKKTRCTENRPPDFVPSTTIDFTHPST